MAGATQPRPRRGGGLKGKAMRLAMVFLGSLLLAAAPARRGAEELGWMSGRWLAQSGERWTEEHWTRPRGGVMLGTGLSGRGGEADNWEFMRIAPDAEGALTFWGSPNGQPAVPFRLVSLSAGEAIFENPAHDFPTRIVYRRTGSGMTATVSGPNGANPQTWRYKRR